MLRKGQKKNLVQRLRIYLHQTRKYKPHLPRDEAEVDSMAVVVAVAEFLNVVEAAAGVREAGFSLRSMAVDPLQPRLRCRPSSQLDGVIRRIQQASQMKAPGINLP